MNKGFVKNCFGEGKKKGSALLAWTVVLGLQLAMMSGCAAARIEGSGIASGHSGESGQYEENDMQSDDIRDNSAEDPDAEEDVQDRVDVRIYDEIESEGVTYQTRSDGIYCLEGDREERIYDRYAGQDTQLCLFEGRLYFKTNDLHDEGISNLQDTTIRWIDLQTLENGDLDMIQKDGQIKSFSIRQGIVTIRYMYANEEPDVQMLYSAEDTVWNGKGIPELTEDEKQQYGQSLTRTVLQEQGVLTNVSNRVPNRNMTYLDMDGDGISEEIVLEPRHGAGEAVSDEPLRYFRLRIGEAAVNTHGYNVDNTLRAFSLDGETLLLAIYEDGPSADPLTRIYQYRNGHIAEIGSFETAIRSCRLEQGGMLSGEVLREIAGSDWIRMNWGIGEGGMLEEVPQEYYDFVRGNRVELCEELPLYSEAGSGEVFLVPPQSVKFVQVSADGSWLLLETEDGQQGWVHVIDGRIEDLDQHVADVFRGGYLAG